MASESWLELNHHRNSGFIIFTTPEISQTVQNRLAASLVGHQERASKPV
jgi:hypothetical protein